MTRRPPQPHRPSQAVRGYTLVELIISMSAATLLMGGLAASLFMTIDSVEIATSTNSLARVAQVQADVVRDLERATGFSQLEKEIVEFTVPDETGDGLEETLAYEHDKDNDQLLFTYNGTTVTLLSGVENCDFEFLERSLTGSAALPAPYDDQDWGTRWVSGPVFQGFTEVKQGDGSPTSIGIPTPSSTESGDLLIAALVVDKDNAGLSPPSGEGWTQIANMTHDETHLTFGVWWKIADASEPATHDFSKPSNQHGYGWIMRFTGHDPVNPINDSSSQMTESRSSSPPSPAVTTTVDEALILRLGGFDDDDVSVDDPGLSDHTAITMDETDSGKGTSSGGAGYVLQTTAGDSGSSNFSLNNSEEWITVTIAIAPE